MYKVLIIRQTYDSHIIRFIKNLKEYNPKAEIDFVCQTTSDPPAELCYNVKSIYRIESAHNKIALFRVVLNFISIRRFFRNLSSKEHYNVINIHFPSYEYSFATSFLKKCADFLVLTPWGSDVYRISKIKKLILKHLFNKADYICGIGNRFDKDVRKMFCVPSDKIVYLSMGSDTIDFFIDNIYNINTDGAKKVLGVDNSYVITCGYNGSKGQNHSQIIQAIIKSRNQLPENLVLFFPFTYAGTQKYRIQLETMLKSNNIHFKFFTEFLSLKDLLILRMATDIFIHVQVSDANSSSLKEYILCDKKVINGAWMQYDDLNEYTPKPYFELDCLNDLEDFIVNVFRAPRIQINEMTKNNIKKLGYKYWTPRWDAFFRKCSTIIN